MMISFKFLPANATFITEHIAVNGVFVCLQNMRRFECLRAFIAMEIPFLEMGVSVVDHVALGPEFLAYNFQTFGKNFSDWVDE